MVSFQSVSGSEKARAVDGWRRAPWPLRARLVLSLVGLLSAGSMAFAFMLLPFTGDHQVHRGHGVLFAVYAASTLLELALRRLARTN